MQDLIVYFIVACAALYIGKMLVNAAVGKKSGCNGCGSNCASQKKSAPERSTPAAAPLMQIGLNNLNGQQKK